LGAGAGFCAEIDSEGVAASINAGNAHMSGLFIAVLIFESGRDE
jgi:hypothetical protein